MSQIGLFLFLAILLWAPLFYASNRPWAWSLLALLLAVTLLFVVCGHWLQGERVSMPAPVACAGLCVMAAGGWAFLQTVPGLLPGDWAHPIWHGLAELGLAVEPVVALSVENARDNLLRLASYVAAFTIAFLLGQHSKTARRILIFVLIVTAALAAYGLIKYFAGWHTWLGEPTTARPHAGYVTGTFVNRNNFATYLNLGIVVGLALLFESLLAATSGAELRRLFAALLERIIGYRGLLLLALLVLVTATLLTGSRGGFLSLLAAILTFLALALILARPTAGRTLATLLVSVSIFLGALALAGNLTLKRLAELDDDGSGRLQAYELALAMMAARPWLGYGYGSFEQAFLMHRDPRFEVVFDKAHNTYLEHAVELGLPAAGLLYLGLLTLFLFTLRGLFRRRRQRIFPLVAVCSTVLVGLHALVDFSLQMPAVAVTYATILALGVAQAVPTRERVGERQAKSEIADGGPAPAPA